MGGNKKKFEKFYFAHVDKVYRFVFFRSGQNKELTEDLTSEIFMKALEHFASFDPTKSTSAWLMTIAKNHLANHWRDTKSTEVLPESGGEDDNGSADRLVLNKGLETAKDLALKFELQGYLDQLSEEERRFVTLHYLCGYSYIEMAAELGASEGAVKVATHRAIKKLRRLVV